MTTIVWNSVLLLTRPIRLQLFSPYRRTRRCPWRPSSSRPCPRRRAQPFRSRLLCSACPRAGGGRVLLKYLSLQGGSGVFVSVQSRIYLPSRKDHILPFSMGDRHSSAVSFSLATKMAQTLNYVGPVWVPVSTQGNVFLAHRPP